MRMTPTRYMTKFAPAVVKKTRAKTVHISPPAKGFSFEAKTNTVDPKLAGVLVNFLVDEDRISCRAGYRKLATCPGAAPIDALIPYYGQPERMAAATNNTLCDALTGTLWRSGFTSNDWHWTSFSNLGDREYTIMVNGADGVIAWDGNTVSPTPTPVTITKIAGGPGSPPVVPANPATITVAADIVLFHDGMTVIISGADADHIKANGPHRIIDVNTTPNTFRLVGVDLTGAPGDQTTGTMRVEIQGSFEKTGVLPPEGATWVDPDEFHIVVAHMNRLFFADETNLAFYYLPLQQKDGELSAYQLNAIFKKGGTIKAMGTWTIDGGMGMDDQLVIFTTNGEVAIYSGIDPDTDFSLVGVFGVDTIQSKHSLTLYGGELYVLLSTGVTPMTSMIKAGREGVDMVDKHVMAEFLSHSIAHSGEYGWQLILNPSAGRMFANMPLGGGRYDQMIRHMPKPVWSKFQDIPSRCWGWINDYGYFGDNSGNVYEMHPQYLTDNGAPIKVDVQMAWSQFKTPVLKHFKMVLPYIVTDGYPRPFLDVKVDYDDTAIVNQPEITGADPGLATWDVAVWDEASWTSGERSFANWTGVGSLGRVGAVRLSANVSNCTFVVTGWDVLFEEGSVFG